MMGERDLLARMLQAEAGNQGEIGMRAVAGVINNRRNAQGYGGNTYRDVLLAPGQFSPANSITGYAGGEQGVDLNSLTPNETAYRIADEAMSGKLQDPTGGALNFLNPDISQPSWMNTMQNTMKIGDHLFGTAGTREGSTGRPGGQRGTQPTTSTQGQSPQQQSQPNPREEMGGMFPNLTSEKLDRIANAFMSMSAFPTQGMQMQMQDYQQRQGERRQESRQQKQRSKTADWLRSNGMADLAEGVEYGAISGKDALVMARQQPKDDRTALMKNVEYIQSQNPGMPLAQALEMARSGGVTVNTGDQGPQVGTIPQGYELAQDPESGGYRMQPIPGGPADREIAQESQAQEAARKSQTETRAREKDVVLENIGAIRETLNQDGMLNLPETGIIGDRLARSGLNQEAVNVRNRLSSLQGLVGFDRLQRMRDESPTGGALGAISERELELLSAQLGTLNQSSDKETLMATLDRIERIYSDIMKKAQAYPNASEYGFDGQAAPQGGGSRIRYDAEGNRIQ